MNGRVRVNFYIVMPFVIALHFLFWMIFLPRGNADDNKTVIERLEAGVNRLKDRDISKLTKKQHDLMINKEKPKNGEERNVGTKPPSKSFVGDKLVHLDLKGGAPKMAYLLKLIPTMKLWGATGFLIEYEDMFPYDGELSVLKSPYAYSISEVTKLLKKIKKHELLAVPLVQSFGHMEFVLKHKKFAHLRHQRHMTKVINPMDNGSVPLVKSMIGQILKIHKPYIKHLHIGGDEVWTLKDRKNSDEIYMKHMFPIIDYVVSSKITPVIWDDMMRRWTVATLKKMNDRHVEPMVWAYRTDLSQHFPGGMWNRYGEAFDKIWIASAFKGAETPTTDFVFINDRIRNHQEWFKITTELRRHKMKISGIALTGWSRYFHDAALCELLPASLPSLALCLAFLKEGQLSKETLSSVSRKLGFNAPIILNPSSIPENPENPDEGTFPGHSIFGTVLRLRRVYNTIDSVKVRIKSSLMNIVRNFIKETFRKLGWYNDRKSVLRYIEKLDGAISLLDELKPVVQKKFPAFFNQDTIGEWIMDKITTKRRIARKLKEYYMTWLEKI